MISKRHLSIAAGLAAAFLHVSLASAAPKDTERRIGNWIADETTCTVSATFRNGRSLIIGNRSAANPTLAIRSTHWRIPAGYRDTILFWADDDDPHRGTARGTAVDTVRVGIDDPEWISAALDRAKSISIVFGEQTYRFPITHGDRVSSWLADCTGASKPLETVETPGRTETAPPIVAGESTAPHWLTQTVPPPARSGPDRRRPPEVNAAVAPARDLVPVRGADAVRFAMATLSSAGVEGYRVSVPTARRDWPVSVNAVWQAEGVDGAVRRYRALTDDLIYGERRRIADRDRAECRDTFSAARMPMSHPRVTDLVTLCTSGGVHRVRYYAFVGAGNEEGFLLMSERSGADLAPIWGANLTLAAAAVGVAGVWN